MKKSNLSLVIALMLCFQLLNAQDIFKQHGFDKEPLTLSNGSYNEFFKNDEVVQIGTVLLNTKTNKMVAFVAEDTSKTKYLAENSSRWLSIDAMASKFPEVSPYVYVRNNPILRLDPNGLWDVTVHVYNNRKQHGYGVAIVTDRSGNEVYRYNVRAEGTGGRDRMQKNADTPLGVYDIPDDNAWLTGGSRTSYGPNARLNMSPVSGEISESGRDQIRIHGGRQEVYDSKTKTWKAVDNPQLKKTNGCLRANDADMSQFKQITDNLQANDNLERPGQVSILGNLQKEVTPASEDNKVEVNVQYKVPTSELDYWKGFVNNLLNNNSSNGGQ